MAAVGLVDLLLVFLNRFDDGSPFAVVRDELFLYLLQLYDLVPVLLLGVKKGIDAFVA